MTSNYHFVITLSSREDWRWLANQRSMCKMRISLCLCHSLHSSSQWLELNPLSVCFVSVSEEVHLLLKQYHLKPGGQRGARQSYSASADNAVCPCAVHTYAYHTHICFCQLIITNCSSLQALAKWPRLSGLVGQEFPLSQTRVHKQIHTTNLAKVFTCEHLCVCLHMHVLSVCMLSPPPCINHCPPSNEGERTGSLKHLIPTPIELRGRMGARQREREKNPLR